MSWQTTLVLVAAGLLLVLAGILTAVLVCRSLRKKLQAALADVARLQGDLDAARDDIARLLDLADNVRLDDADAIQKLRAGLSRWRATDSRSGSVDAGGAGSGRVPGAGG